MLQNTDPYIEALYNSNFYRQKMFCFLFCNRFRSVPFTSSNSVCGKSRLPQPTSWLPSSSQHHPYFCSSQRANGLTMLPWPLTNVPKWRRNEKENKCSRPIVSMGNSTLKCPSQAALNSQVRQRLISQDLVCLILALQSKVWDKRLRVGCVMFVLAY